MRLPARTIWDTRIQAVCSAVSALDREHEDVELWMCGNFGQASLDPPRIVINPNRLYPIDGVIRREGRFALSVFPASGRDAALRLAHVRRRTPEKARAAGLPLHFDEQHGIPWIGGTLRTLFCEVEEILDTGDHSLVIARLLEAREHASHRGERPLLYREVSGTPSRYRRLQKLLRHVLTRTGVLDALRKQLLRRRGTPPADLPALTYREGGQTDQEMAEILRHGASDRSRHLHPPEAPALLRRRVGVCVAGAGAWGSYHCQLFREASPRVDLYVCGRDSERTARLARASRAKDYFLGLERALADPRVEAVSLALPHHLHAQAARQAAAAGKHVLVEKPIATNLDDADAMIADARQAGVILMVAEDVHFRPAIREAARAIARGDIGEPLYLNVHAGGVMRPEGWKANKDLMGGGVLMDIGVHYVRALRLLLGEPDRVLATRAMQINTKISGDDSVQALFASRFGWQAHLLLSWAGPRGHAPDIVVAGDQGVLHLWPGAGYYDLYPAAPQPVTVALSYLRPRRLAERLMSPVWQRVRRRIADEDRRGYLSEVREFLAAVGEGRSPASPPADARRDLEIVLCAYAALRDEIWTPIPPWSARP